MPTALPPSLNVSRTAITCSRLSSSSEPKPSSTNSVCRSKPPASARTASPIPSARAREAMNASPPDNEDGHHLFQAFLIERTEALIDEQRLQVEAPGLGPHGVAHSQRQSQRGHERLASRQRGRLTRL